MRFFLILLLLPVVCAAMSGPANADRDSMTSYAAGMSNESAVEDVEGAMRNVVQYAGTDTPVFVTMAAVLILAGVVVVVWKKNRSTSAKKA